MENQQAVLKNEGISTCKCPEVSSVLLEELKEGPCGRGRKWHKSKLEGQAGARSWVVCSFCLNPGFCSTSCHLHPEEAID